MADDIESQADGLIRSFRLFAQARGPGACLYVLIDPLLGDPLPDLAATEKVPVRALTIQHEDLAKEEAPYLLKVGQEQDHERLIAHTLHVALAEQKTALLESPASRSVCAWLFVNGDDPFKLTEALSRFALITRPGTQGKRQLFRFWDPRVFQHLARILGQRTLENALADKLAVQWLWLSPSGELGSHVFQDGSGWRPSLAEWHALSRIEDLNQCLLLSETQKLMGSSEHIVNLDHALQRAAQLGCQESADRITYAVLSMSLGGPFENHALMADLFRQVARDQASLAALAEAIEQDAWDRIKHDMAQARKHQKSGTNI